MKVALNWLKDYVEIKEAPVEVGLAFTMHTAEVEGIEQSGTNFSNMIVGKVLKLEKHPNADKLQIVDVLIAEKEQLTLVCGGTNLRPDMFVAVALIGAKVRWHGAGELVILEAAKIRGIESKGMICASSEIGLGESISHEILDLEQYLSKFPDKISILKPGLPLGDLFGKAELVMEFDNKSLNHRSDLFGHLGLAREYSAIMQRKFSAPKLPKIKSNSRNKLKVVVSDPGLCPRYLAVVLDNLKVGPAPEWMQERLKAVGVRPINNIVDITNYVMLEYAQPLHAFDYHKLFKQEINVRKAKPGEKIITLDGVERTLQESMLVIADQQKPIALAGIMGGQNSEIEEKTRAIVLESANFDKVSIRRTAQKLGLRTEAVMRFEKGLGLDLPEEALKRAVDLLIKYAGGEVASKTWDVLNADLKEKVIDFPLAQLNSIAGINFEIKKVIKILEALALTVKVKGEILQVTIPLFRTDLNIPEDLVEEVCRIYGYDNFTPKNLQGELSPVEQLPENILQNNFEEQLAAWGYTETQNYSFYRAEDLHNYLLKESQHLQVVKPLNADLRYLRISLFPGLLNNLKVNLDQGFSNLHFFEIGHTYTKDFQDEKWLALVISGPDAEVVYNLKGSAEKLLKPWEVEFNAQGTISFKGEVIGKLQLIPEAVLNNFGINEKVAGLEINFSKLMLCAKKEVKYQVLNKFPAVKIDLAIVLPEEYSWAEVRQEILLAKQPLSEIELFDVYQGKNIGAGNKSFALHLTYQAATATLTMEAVEKMRTQLVELLHKKFNAIIRDK